ncbi:hypothetical protein ACFOZY_10715 [Chungangia koreensis]|uniref:DUF3828 domain-containing protein n=1 Tax=Chungangia koreensis TaxID=752657 RepID=A0ABV8X4N1_9LACT
MKKILFLCLCLIGLVGCSESVDEKPDSTNEQHNHVGKEKKDEQNPSDPEHEEETEKAVTEEEAMTIAKKLVREFNQLMIDMGEKKGWNFENPADYETAKPELLKLATEEFSDRHLKEYVETYYCNCDSIWAPSLNDQTVRMETEIEEEAFTVKGLVLPNYVSGGFEMTLEVVKQDGNWKIDGWNSESFIGKDMNFTKEEIQVAHPDKDIKEEQYLEQFDVTVYIAESEQEILGISKKDGTLFGIE